MPNKIPSKIRAMLSVLADFFIAYMTSQKKDTQSNSSNQAATSIKYLAYISRGNFFIPI